MPVVGGVVVPRHRVQDRALREHVRRLVGVDDLPRLLVVDDVGQHLAAAVEVNRLEQHPAAPEVHVGLEAQDQRRLGQRPEPLVPRHRVGRNAQQRDPVQGVVVDEEPRRHPVRVQGEVVAGREQPVLDRLAVQPPVVADAGADAVGGDDQLGHLPLGVELHADLLPVDGLLAPRVVVRGEPEQAARRQLPPRAVGIVLAGAAHGVLDEVDLARVRPHAEPELIAVLHRLGHADVDVRVVHAAVRLGDDLHPLHVAVLGQPRVDDLGRVEVGALGGNLEALLHLDDEVGLAVGPLVERRELEGRRRVGGVAAGGAGRDPVDDGGDLGVAQRRVGDVLADAAVDVPRRHLAGDDAVADGPRPGPRLLVGQQRHRGAGARPVALLARALQQGQHVAGEGGAVLGLAREGGVRAERTGREGEGGGKGDACRGEAHGDDLR